MKLFIKIVISIYLFVSILAFLVGIMSANRGDYFWGPLNGCMKRPSRAERFFPSYKLGCYVLGALDKPYYYEDKKK
jgi:hypothetical protein